MKPTTKKNVQSRCARRGAFTLIELLIVVAVIAVLAGLLFPAMQGISVGRMKKVAYAELREVEAAINTYKAKKGFYPPDNATNSLVNPLYYELMGTIFTNDPIRGRAFITLDGTSWISTNNVMAVYGLSTFANCSTTRGGTDDRPAPESFLKELKGDQLASFAILNGGNRVALQCSEGWTRPGSSGPAPWNYNSSHPTNNPASFDLWVDLYIRGKTNRISNWASEPQVLP